MSSESVDQLRDVTDYVWTISELVKAALHRKVAEPISKQHGHLTVIEGGAA